MRCKQIVTAAAVLSFALAGSAFGRAPVVGQAAPDFSAIMVGGQRLTMADFKGQVLVINFWATWCGPCKRELPLLDAYYKIQKEHGLRVIAVTTEDSLPVSELSRLIKVLSIPMVWRFSGVYAAPDGVPTNYVIDKAGVVRYAKAGAFDLDTLNSVLVPLLQEPAPATATPVAAR